ncbi:YbhN family protein [Arcticibacter sp.]|uniref:lysylphosphatidylglycerol synthase transmembrane domain-containing protein n=1 Tax=Arcticibacter sp. TaxID=1872630 RepID=UPI00388CF73C
MSIEEEAEIAEESTTITGLTSRENPNQFVFNKSMILKGAMWLGLLTIASVAAVFFYSHTGDTIKALKSIKFKYILICFAMVFTDLILGGWRNHILIQKLKPGLSQWISFKANTANMFMGAITPFHSGAGPAQLYVYNRHGVQVLDGFVVSLITMGATLLFMPLAGLLAIWAMNTQLESGLILTLLKYGFGVFFIFLLVFMLAFWRPLLIGSVLINISKIISLIWPAKKAHIEKWADWSYASILNYQQICKKLLKDHPLLFPLSLLITVLLYLNKYCMQYVILLGLGVHVDLLQVISIQILIQFMIYFAPSPGGSGFAEAGIAMLFSQIVPTSALPVFTLLQRSFLMLFPAMIGAFVVLKLLKTHAAAVGDSDHMESESLSPHG